MHEPIKYAVEVQMVLLIALTPFSLDKQPVQLAHHRSVANKPTVIMTP